MIHRFPGIAALILLVPAAPVHAQTISLEGTTDARERGISWSDGQPALEARASIPAFAAFDVDLRATTLRNSARHGGSELGLTVSPRFRHGMGGLSLSAGMDGHVFLGESRLNFVEASAGLDYSIGPARVDAGVSYAPRQKAIGGDNLYLHAGAAIGVPGTPLTVYGGGGYTSGSTRNAVRAARLRPGGNAWDHYVGVEHSLMKFAVGLRYSDTTVNSNRIASPFDDRHAGSRLAAYVRLTL